MKRRRERRLGGRTQWLFLAIVLLAGVAMRVSYLREILAAPEFATPVADAAFHDYWARGLATGNWSPPQGEVDPRIREVPFLRPPGYPYFLAGLYGTVGSDVADPRIFQMLLGLVNAALAFLLGRALFGPVTGLVLAAFGAGYWAFLYFEGELQAPVLIQTLLLSLAWLLHRWSVRRSLLVAALAGLCCGALALVRANALLFAPVVVVWMAVLTLRRGGAARAVVSPLIFLVLMAAAIAPASWRNVAVANDFVLISSNGAVNFYIGNNEESDGVTPKIPELQEWTGLSGWSWFSYDQIVQGLSRKEGRELSHSDASAFFAARAREFIRENPGEALRQWGRRARLFWSASEISNNKAIRFEKAHSPTLRWGPGFAIVLAVSIAGLALLLFEWRAGARDAIPEESRGTVVLVALLLLTYFASFVPFLAAARFRVPILPFVFLFGAYGLARLPALFASGMWGRLASAAVAGGAFFLISNASALESEVDKAWWHTDRANALLRAGDPDAAFDEFHAALAENPGYIDAHVHLALALIDQQRLLEAEPHLTQVLDQRPYRNDLRVQLGAIYMMRGEYGRAVEHFETALQVDPDVPDLYFEYGRALTEAGRFDEGIEAFRSSLNMNPDQAEAHVNIGIALERMRRPREAVTAYREALDLDPFLETAHYNLGNALQATGALDEAAEAFEEAIRIDPKYVQPMIHLGNLNNENGRYAEAVSWYEKAIGVEPRNARARFNLSGALGNLGRLDEAIEQCRIALEINPADPAVRQRLQQLEAYRAQRSGSNGP